MFFDDKIKTRDDYIERLKEEKNYENWNIRIKNRLTKKRWSKYIKKRNYNSLSEIDEVKSKNFDVIKINAELQNLCDDDSLMQIKNLKDSFDIYESLINLYASKEFSFEFLLCRELFNTTLEESNDSMQNYLNIIKRLKNQLNIKNLKISEKMIYAWVLNNLIDEYEIFIITITQNIRNDFDKIKLSELFFNLLDESRRVDRKHEISQIALHLNVRI